MPYYIAVYDWSLYTLPGSIPMSNIEGDTHSNDPAHPDYSASSPTWIGETFTFNGGSSIPIEIDDDDGQFEDRYVESGSASTLNQDVTINGTTYLAGSVIENEFSVLDATGDEVFVIRIDGVNIGFGYPVGQEPTPGSSFTGTVGRDGAAEDSGDGVSSSSEPYSSIVCYAQGTLIDTPDGPRSVESLQVGDLVHTLDHGPQPIRWVRISGQPLEDVESDAKPVLIGKGALGRHRPVDDLIVSPQHRILVGEHQQLQGRFASEAFAPAKSFTKLKGIRHMQGKTKINWVHFACDRHEIVTANGCLSESLLLGPMVVNGLTDAERQAVIDIFGEASAPDAALNGLPARKCLKVGAVRRQLAKKIGWKAQRIAKEFRKWDVNTALERNEASRLREANPARQDCKNYVA